MSDTGTTSPTSEHACSDFRRHIVDGKYIFRCVECAADRSSDDMSKVVRSYVIRPADIAEDAP